jgi:hypothetical protein
MAILLSVLKSLELFLSLKNKLFYYEIRTKSIERQKDILAEIKKLRDAGDSASADAADLLRSELKREREELTHLSTFYAPLAKKPTDSNP